MTTFYGIRRTRFYGSVDPGDTKILIDVAGSGVLIAYGLYVDGLDLTAKNSELKYFIDGEVTPRYALSAKDVKYPFVMAMGTSGVSHDGRLGVHYWNEETYQYSHFIFLYSTFKTHLKVSITNGDPANPTTMHCIVLWSLD